MTIFTSIKVRNRMDLETKYKSRGKAFLIREKRKERKSKENFPIEKRGRKEISPQRKGEMYSQEKKY